MDWSVTGAVEQTGDEITRVFEARTREEAEAKARLAGILVADVRAETEAVDVGVLPYRTAGARPPPALPVAQPPLPVVPATQTVPAGHLLTLGERMLIVVLLVGAALLIASGVVGLVFAGAPLSQRFADDNAWGATANRLEDLKTSAVNLRGAVQIAAGLIAVCAAAVIRLRGTSGARRR